MSCKMEKLTSPSLFSNLFSHFSFHLETLDFQICSPSFSGKAHEYLENENIRPTQKQQS